MNSSFETFFKKINISIIGGTGGMGRLFVNSLKDITNVMICSRDLNKAAAVAKKIGENIKSGILEDCRNSDIVVVSVPLENVLKTISKAVKIMKEGSLLMDLSSVKSGFINKLEIPDSIEYISAHFLFGPQGNFSDENIILIPVKGEQWLAKIKYLFEKLGGNVFIISKNEHDIKMSKIQSLFHFTIICMVIAMTKSNIEPNFYTRSFKMIIPNLKNLKNNLKVILEIQKNNPFSQKERKYFAKLVHEISNLDHVEFEKLVIKSFENLII
ncbi:MAG: prephenate dehydrogenase/arogenate dehydrogenase family protein [Promethearchaeota archaeon]